MSNPNTESFEDQLNRIINGTSSQIAVAIEAASRGYKTGSQARALVQEAWNNHKAAIQAYVDTRVAEARKARPTIEIPASTTGYQIIAYAGKDEWRSPIYGRETLPAQLKKGEKS